jgi:hypothetical protein
MIINSAVGPLPTVIVATTESACTIEDSKAAIADIMVTNIHKIIATVGAFIDLLKEKITIIYLT